MARAFDAHFYNIAPKQHSLLHETVETAIIQLQTLIWTWSGPRCYKTITRNIAKTKFYFTKNETRLNLIE